METVADPAIDQPTTQREPVFWALLRYAAWILSGLLLAGIWLSYWCRFDTCAAVTVYPPWSWAAIGLLAAGLGYTHRHWVVSCGLAVLWLLFLLTVADSPGSLLRGLVPEPPRDTSLRVVTLNCASFGAAAREALALGPDIALLQESPAREELFVAALNTFGPGHHVHWGIDASIVARGEVTPVDVPAEFRENFVHARVTLDGKTFEVISLRLAPCPVRMDLWSSNCWEYYRINRERRRRQLARIAAYVQTLRADVPLIVGGDFNCPPGDAVLRLLQPRLIDAFPVAGRGWGATIIDVLGWPLIRIDQIWTCSQLRAINAFARKCNTSDHHLAGADFVNQVP